MLDLDPTQTFKPRCLVTNTKLPKYLDSDQPPRKKRPFSTVLNFTFAYSLNLLLPAPAARRLQAHFSQNATASTLHYHKVHLTLLNILTGPFFTTHLKTPCAASADLTMLSAGRPGIDNTFSLHRGILRMDIDRATYERLGLPGTPTAGAGRKHIRARYVVESDLRAPHMVRGKPAFGRLLWACENVLSDAVTWLVCTARGDGGGEGGIEGLAEHAPVVRRVEPEVRRLMGAKVPVFPPMESEEEFAEAAEVLEWLTLAGLGSPRLLPEDGMDAYLSRYQVPGEHESGDLVSFRWTGLIPPDFAHRIFLMAIKASGTEWAAMSSSTFDGHAYTILIHDDRAVTWEYKC